MGILTFELKITYDGVSESWPVFRIEMTGILIKKFLFQLFSLSSVGSSVVTPPPTYTLIQPGWERYLIWRLITRRLGGQCMKLIKTVWNCGPGSKLDMLVRLNWIPSGVSMGRKLGRLNLSPVGHLANASNYFRTWKVCGDKLIGIFNCKIDSLLRWLNRLKTRSSLDPAIVSIIGIKPRARSMMRKLRSVLMISVK